MPRDTKTGSDHIGFRVEGHVAHVVLDRPQKLNAITPEMDAALLGVWRRINADAEIWCAILSASGNRAFCAGADLGDGGDDTEGDRRQSIAFGGGLTGIGGPQFVLNKPLIAAVHGHCLGGGFEFALCADMIVAAEDASFGLPETAAGIIGHCGVVHRAVRRLPYAVAMGLILANRRLSAKEAAAFGLVNMVVEPAILQLEARALAEQVLACSPLANVAAKAALRRGLEGSLEGALQATYREIEHYADSADFREVSQARAQGRRPVWSGY
jgi:enoyl-CoA hydratase/carnithine racemase